MKLGTIRRVLKEDIGRFGDLPKWIDALLGPLNEFLEQVTRALQNRLTFEDNFQCTVKEVTFTNGVEQEISPGSNIRVSGVQVFDAGGKKVTGFGFTRKTNGNLGVTIDFTPSGRATCTILIFLG